MLTPLRRELENIPLRGHGTATGGTYGELFDYQAWLWTFLEMDGVEPTNNAAGATCVWP